MRLRFETCYRAGLLLLVALLLWATWVSAQPSSTNAPATTNAVTAAPAPMPLVPGLSGQERYLTFGLDRIEFLRARRVFGEPLSKYLASLIYIFLAFYAAKVVDFLARVWLKRLAERTRTRLDDLLLQLVHGPLKVVTFVLLLSLGLSVFQWPPVIQTALRKAFIVVVAVSLTYMLVKLVDLTLGYWKARAAAEPEQALDEQLLPLIRKSLKVFVVVVATLVTAQNLDINITGLIASLSIGGLALGLAAQDTLANLFGAVAVLLDKPFRVGDRVQLEGVDGVVESIGLRSTRVRNLDGHLITIPNKTMGNATITNITRRPSIRTLMNIGVTYDTPAPKVQRAVDLLYEIYKAHPMTQDVWISFNKFADCALNILVIHWWNSTVYKDYLAGMQELNLKIKERFDAEGISFAFPTQTLYVRQDSEWRWAAEASPQAA